MKMFGKISQICDKKAEEEREKEKEKEKENDTEEDQPILWTPEPSGDY